MNIKKTLPLIFTTLFAVLYFGHKIMFSVELDDKASNSPIKSKITEVTNSLEFNDTTLAAGLTYNEEKEVFYASTDQPHKLFAKPISEVIEYDKNFKELKKLSIKTDGDLEGIVYDNDKNLLYTISEVGTLYTIDPNEFKVIKSEKI